jgi:uncharacterized membrane protein
VNFLGVSSKQANVSMAHWCRQTKHVTWITIVVDMAMGVVVGVNFSFQTFWFFVFNF